MGETRKDALRVDFDRAVKFGEGVGAKKERHRLVELIENQSKKHKKKSKKKK